MIVRAVVVVVPVLVAVATSTIGATPRARAQDAGAGAGTAGAAGGAGARATAAREFDAGEAAARQSDFGRALEHFQRAFALAPNDAVRFNIALALERLGRFREAAIEYDQAYLGSLPEDARQRARQSASRVRAELGTLIVDGDPPGADVSVDDHPLCTIPCRTLVDPGRHRVAARDGEREIAADVVVSRRAATSLRLSLARQREVREHGAATTPSRERARSRVTLTPPPSSSQDDSSGYAPGWIGWVGAAVAAAGGAGVLVFGLRTESLFDDYWRTPTRETLDEGERMRTFANVSIGVLALGVALFAADVILFMLDD